MIGMMYILEGIIAKIGILIIFFIFVKDTTYN